MTPEREKPVNDAQPNPEPAVPSLAEPDPCVFHHEPGAEPKEKKKSA
jgi:hypothetical protein